MRYLAGLDGLRAISVLLVLLFHAGIPMFSRGYLGVLRRSERKPKIR